MLKQYSRGSLTMEFPSFSMGHPSVQTKRQRIERLRKKQKIKSKKLQYSNFMKPRPIWFLLPHHVCGFDFWIAMLKGDTFFSKRAALLEDIEKAKNASASRFEFPSFIDDTFRNEYLVKAENVLSFLYQNQKIRWILKAFFTRLRIQRFRSLNQEDPITLEAITEPIRFPSFSQRKNYVFEAKPFAKHLHNNLIHNDGHIPEPMFPKNPFTNEHFTQAQIMSLIDQARTYSHTSWAIESFIACRYNLSNFLSIHAKPLRLHALRATMANLADWDSIDTLYDFIKTHHELNGVTFSMSIYKWAVKYAQKEKRIESWRKLCIKWYEIDILIDDAVSKDDLFRRIEAKTFPLCSKPEELISLRNKKAKSPVTTDGSGNP